MKVIKLMEENGGKIKHYETDEIEIEKALVVTFQKVVVGLF